MTEMDELKAARVQVNALAEAIHTEMREQAINGYLWQNSRCKAWPEYKLAVDNQQMLRAKYGV